MGNIKILLIHLFLLFNTLFSFAQTIECENIEFNLEPTTFADSGREEKGIWLKVRANLSVNDLKNDTITLKTNVKKSLLGPVNLEANLIDNNGCLSPLLAYIDGKSGSYFADYQLLKIVIPKKKKANLSIAYNVICSNFLKYRPGSVDFYSCQQRNEYFYPINVPIKKLEVTSPDSIKYFVAYKLKNNTIIEDINLAFINRNRYKEKSINGNMFNISIYIPDTLLNNKKIQQNNIDLEQYMNKFSAYLSHNKVSDIIYINWRDDKNRRSFGEALGNYVVCDINFQGKDLLHELIHIFLPTEVEQFSKGEYFIKESIIEWLGLFLSNKTINIKPLNTQGSISLYDTQINDHTTWNLIYTTGPSIIQQIASKYGEEQMASVIISFLEKNQNKVINYKKFIAYLNKHLPSNLCKEMDYLVKFTSE